MHLGSPTDIYELIEFYVIHWQGQRQDAVLSCAKYVAVLVGCA